MSDAQLQPEVQAQLEAQKVKVRTLKEAKASKDQIDTEVALLQDLKKKVGELRIGGGASSSSNNKKKEAVKFTLKTAKGTRDWDPLSMSLRSHIFKVIETVFKTHGGVTIDTPVFELKEILSGKYGEDSKLIYDLQDQGGELCSLRYDLTVPFARFVAMNPSEYGNIKRYHIAKVYRRDQPAMAKGRFREFYQCDFDISGVYDPLIPDAEILHILTKALDSLGIRQFTIKLNHRALLDGLFAVCGVPDDKIRTISSAVDKLDKSPWAEVKKEMIEKGLEESKADAIGVYVSRKGGRELVEELFKDEKLLANPSAKRGLEELQILFGYLDVLEVSPRISFDLSLARGLDYYTGIIYEAITEGSAPPPKPSAGDEPGSAGKTSGKGKSSTAAAADDDDASATVGVGSIAAGGRYDNLVGMFSGASSSKSAGQVPCVGISIGVERVFSIMMARLAKIREQQQQQVSSSDLIRPKDTQAFIMSVGKDGMLVERMSIAKKLWEAGIQTEYSYKLKPKLPAQFNTIAKDSIPFAIMIAPDEWSKKQVRVKEQKGKDASAESGDDKGELVDVDKLVEYLKEKTAKGRLSSEEILNRVMQGDV
ncbi:unnamed protein product [Sympodiomycopsis kandeliae]